MSDTKDPSILTGKAAQRYLALHDALFEFSRLFDYEEQNDRAIAIVGAAFLDTILEHILTAFFVDDEKEVKELLQPEKPLGTYGGRTRMVYCLGLINQVVRDDLRLVGKIRNKFAHDLYASFADEKIKAWCMALKWHRIAYMHPPDNATARDLFQVGVNQLVGYLNGVVSIARTEKRKIEPYF